MERQEILNKLKAFSQRTVENGCTENEAIAAAKAMQSLQNKYNCTLTELDISMTEYVKDSLKLGNRVKHPVWGALYGVQTFTETKIVSYGTEATVFGQQHKVDNAMYLLTLLQSAMELEWLNYRASEDYYEEAFSHHPRSIRTSFMNGMASRLGSRLVAMHKESRQDVEQPKASNGTALVVIADNALEDSFRKEYPNLRSSRRYTTNRSRGASQAGHNAANRVGLHSGVSGSSSVRLLS